MSKITERVSYLKGLADGMNLNQDKDANKLLLAMLDAMEEMASELEVLTDEHNELADYVESMDDDLADLEDVLFDEDDDEDDEDDEDDDDELITYDCPHCGHQLTFLAEDVDFDEECVCPECGKPVFPELLEEDGEEDEDDGDDEDEEDEEPVIDSDESEE